MDLLLAIILVLVVIGLVGGVFVHPALSLLLVLAFFVLLFRGTRVP